MAFDCDSTCDLENKSSQDSPASVLLEFDMTNNVRRHGSKPWRKSAKACAEERAAARKILQPSSGTGVDVSALYLALRIQTFIEKNHSRLEDIEHAATLLLQAATNAQTKDQVNAAISHVKSSMEAAGLSSAFESLQVQPTLVHSKLQLMHEVMTRLWLGGWQPLQENCKALREQHVTHVVSIISAGKRHLPDFIKSHYYIQIDDNEGAANELFQYFQPIASFIDEALSSGHSVYVHCGAGISRGPTAVAAYMMWKLKVHACTALNLIRRVRPIIRPNIGFVSQLKLWEGICIGHMSNKSNAECTHASTEDHESVGASVQDSNDFNEEEEEEEEEGKGNDASIE